MGYTCPRCNGNGILNYDSDLPRFQQEHCPVCEGEGVVHRKSFEAIKEDLEETMFEQTDFYEPLKKVGMDENDFAFYINSLEDQIEEKIFTIRMLDDQDAKEENPHFYCLFVFENREILRSKISTEPFKDKMGIRTQGKWL